MQDPHRQPPLRARLPVARGAQAELRVTKLMSGSSGITFWFLVSSTKHKACYFLLDGCVHLWAIGDLPEEGVGTVEDHCRGLRVLLNGCYAIWSLLILIVLAVVCH